MAVENDKRRNLSDYARARRYRAALTEGLYATRGELAQAMGLSNAQLSKFLGFAELPDEMVTACKDMASLPLTTGYLLASLCRKGYQPQILELLPAIESGEISVRRLEEMAADPQLLDQPKKATPVSKVTRTTNPAGSRDDTRYVLSSTGHPLFAVRLSQRRGTVSFTGRLRTLLEDEAFLERLQVLVEEAESGYAGSNEKQD